MCDNIARIEDPFDSLVIQGPIEAGAAGASCAAGGSLIPWLSRAPLKLVKSDGGRWDPFVRLIPWLSRAPLKHSLDDLQEMMKISFDSLVIQGPIEATPAPCTPVLSSRLIPWLSRAPLKRESLAHECKSIHRLIPWLSRAPLKLEM